MSSIWAPGREDVFIVGLTGGIASGKSEVSKRLESLGAFLVDADDVARYVVEPGRPAYEKIVSSFGESILDQSGCIDRNALGRVVFTDPDKRKTLNQITHPFIFKEIARRISSYSDGSEGTNIVVVDAALIVDVGISDAFDCVIVVDSDPELQIDRLVRGRGMEPELARSRVESQISSRERLSAADLVIENKGDLSELDDKVRVLWESIKELASRERG